ncbi:anti-sigma factor antagonist [Nostocaceae cyanobacterium CENA369]|uniref:Anti-sigma factor antagonist n=1 Tax=Dendronalium phyllosphericum CENA369 TaxID=1725256 RepID=A0A8J7I5T0_9NOST|nr:anti-sigma factor antagonist [Dendronalium phyllosphericum]MBH8574403.1 anti-sigma factor antagonist [Dendronalium phyllosphericum CENA369]
MKIKIETLQVTLLETAPEEIAVNELPEVTVVEIAEDIDTNTAPLIQEQILPLAQAGIRMILEMTKVRYMSSAGLRMLLSLYRQISAKGGQIILVGLSEDIRDTMSITGFLDFFKTSDTLEQALEALKVQVQVTRT